MVAVFSRLLPVAASGYGLQIALALIFVPLENADFYDLGGIVGFLSSALGSLYYSDLKAKFWDRIPGAVLPAITTFAPRQLILTAALSGWILRLGTFLIKRTTKSGGDFRMNEIKRQPGNFTFYWIAQATWVFVVGLPVYLVNSIPSSANPPLGVRDYLSIALFAGSWLLEIVADHQKTCWRRAKDNKEHDEKFITKGLWSISRHPNYVGEVGLWTGIWALSIPALSTRHVPSLTWLIAGASPLLTWYLLRNFSGVPLLEEAGDSKFAGPEWSNYKKTVPVFWPWGSAS